MPFVAKATDSAIASIAARLMAGASAVPVSRAGAVLAAEVPTSRQVVALLQFSDRLQKVHQALLETNGNCRSTPTKAA